MGTNNLIQAILTGDNAKLARVATSCRKIAANQPKRSLKEFYLLAARTAEKQIIINNSHRIYLVLKTFNHAKSH